MKKRCGNRDYITGKPLSKTFNLHHLDQRKEEEHYTDLSDVNRFTCLNTGSHDCLHFIYRYWVKDKEILSRIEELLRKMEEYSDGSNPQIHLDDTMEQIQQMEEQE